MEIKFTKEWIMSLLKDYPEEDTEKFASYCLRIALEKTKEKTDKNPWMQYKTNDNLAILFKRVMAEWLVFDWVHITLQSTGISFDHKALKNKMLLVYPESIIDVQLVFEWDEIEFSKENWSVKYSHKISNPFERKDTDVKWAYVVIKNKRWEFLTTLNAEEIEKHRKVAKTDYIWKAWYQEMCLKTIMKKACNQHLSDIFQNIIEIDNENSDIELPVSIDLKWKQEIEKIQTMEELKQFREKNQGLWKEFDKLISSKMKQLNS